MLLPLVYIENFPSKIPTFKIISTSISCIISINIWHFTVNLEYCKYLPVSIYSSYISTIKHYNQNYIWKIIFEFFLMTHLSLFTMSEISINPACLIILSPWIHNNSLVADHLWFFWLVEISWLSHEFIQYSTHLWHHQLRSNLISPLLEFWFTICSVEMLRSIQITKYSVFNLFCSVITEILLVRVTKFYSQVRHFEANCWFFFTHIWNFLKFSQENYFVEFIQNFIISSY